MAARYSNNPRTRNLGNTTQFQCLDIRALRRAGRLVDGKKTNWGTAVRVETAEGLALAVLLLIIDLRRTHPPSLKAIYFNWNGYTGEQVIPLIAANQCLGGKRWFFANDDAKCECLYLVHGRFMHREAARLTYRSQSEGWPDRLLRRKEKLEARLKGTQHRGPARGRPRQRILRKLYHTEEGIQDVTLTMLIRESDARLRRRRRREALEKRKQEARRVMCEAKLDVPREVILRSYLPVLDSLKSNSARTAEPPNAVPSPPAEHKPKQDLPEVDLPILSQLGYVQKGDVTGDQLGWARPKIPEPDRQLYFLIDMRNPGRPCAAFIFHDASGISGQLFLLQAVTGRFGRQELRFVCPATSRTSSKLIYKDGHFESTGT